MIRKSQTILVAVALAACCRPLSSNAQQDNGFAPQLHGTLRAKYEYQTDNNIQRFEVRNARISVTGKVVDKVAYKAEIDLCDEGVIKMLDAYTRVTPWKRLELTLGQMRVPFTIDAHRSPHQQYFANRSFIAKQVGNVRDVGFMAGYTFQAAFPVVLSGGVFNGSGLTAQKDYWSKGVNFSAKAQLMLPKGFNVTLSTQKISPNGITVMMYDGGAYYHAHGWHVEGEYLYKHYAHGMFDPVHAVDAFVSYDIPLKNRRLMVRKVSPLVRYDYMSDHSDGTLNEDATAMKTTDYRRSRLTAGMTLSLGLSFVSDIRINYENYFYRHGAMPKISEDDKVVIELMTRF